jgi:hypothetical protein
MKESINPIIFTPDNEPYLGRELLFHFDKLISSCLEKNSNIAPKTHKIKLSDVQQMACVVIPQAISIALSIRELIRQGYLFGANLMLRSLVERAAILLYIHKLPKEIEKWNRGWLHNEAPGLAKMLKFIQEDMKRDNSIQGFQLTDQMNSLMHGRPDSVFANLVPLDDENMGSAVSKILNRPDLCDEICANTIPWLVVVQAMMVEYIENEKTA